MSEAKKPVQAASKELRMAHVLEVWMANPMLSFEEIAKLAGVSVATFLRYRQDKEFMERYEARCREKFKALQAKAIESMEKLMEEGHFQASKYILDGNEYAPKQKVEVSTPTAIKITITESETEEAPAAAEAQD